MNIEMIKAQCVFCKDHLNRASLEPNCNDCESRVVLDNYYKKMNEIERRYERMQETMKPEEIKIEVPTKVNKEFREWLNNDKAEIIYKKDIQPLSLNEYQQLADVTRNKNISNIESLTNYGLGLTGEAGEVADIIKKFVFHGHSMNPEELEKELGDVLWYVATLASTMGLSMERIACKNIDKLRKRYPEGFDQNKSINRSE